MVFVVFLFLLADFRDGAARSFFENLPNCFTDKIERCVRDNLTFFSGGCNSVVINLIKSTATVQSLDLSSHVCGTTDTIISIIILQSSRSLCDQVPDGVIEMLQLLSQMIITDTDLSNTSHDI